MTRSVNGWPSLAYVETSVPLDGLAANVAIVAVLLGNVQRRGCREVQASPEPGTMYLKLRGSCGIRNVAGSRRGKYLGAGRKPAPLSTSPFLNLKARGVCACFAEARRRY